MLQAAINKKISTIMANNLVRRVFTLSVIINFHQIALLYRQVLADPTGTQCNHPSGRTETCVCETADGVIDLTGLSSEDGETAMYVTCTSIKHSAQRFTSTGY